jgi:uncharacterized protein YukJ
MPLKRYGILKGRPIDVQLGAGESPHYQVHIVDDTTDYRIAINVKSKVSPSELLYRVDEQFQHPLLALLPDLPAGFTTVSPAPGGRALDFIRGNLFDPADMRKLPHSVPGPDNDLNEKIDAVMSRAQADENVLVYAFGERWGPEVDRKDKYFGFLPGNGIHDIHMNQGNVQQFQDQDGVWQDGAVLVHFPAADGAPGQWVGIFLAFQSQAWHTDDRTGHAITDGVAHDGAVRIVAALVNSIESPETETVLLLNTTPQAVDLANWAIANKDKKKQPLQGELRAGETTLVRMTPQVPLSNNGGIITLLDAQGLKVDGVAYTKADASRPGWTIVF